MATYRSKAIIDKIHEMKKYNSNQHKLFTQTKKKGEIRDRLNLDLSSLSHKTEVKNLLKRMNEKNEIRNLKLKTEVNLQTNRINTEDDFEIKFKSKLNITPDKTKSKFSKSRRTESQPCVTISYSPLQEESEPNLAHDIPDISTPNITPKPTKTIQYNETHIQNNDYNLNNYNFDGYENGINFSQIGNTYIPSTNTITATSRKSTNFNNNNKNRNHKIKFIDEYDDNQTNNNTIYNNPHYGSNVINLQNYNRFTDELKRSCNDTQDQSLENSRCQYCGHLNQSYVPFQSERNLFAIRNSTQNNFNINNQMVIAQRPQNDIDLSRSTFINNSSFMGNVSPIHNHPSQTTNEMIKTSNCYSYKNLIGVMELSFREEMNYKHKMKMEDFSKCTLNFNNNQNETVFCIYDGHNGEIIQKYLQKNFELAYKRNINKLKKNYEEALKKTFFDLDTCIKKFNTYDNGSTACIAHIIKDPKNTKFPYTIYTANVGDTRCSLISPSLIKRLSYDHRVTNLNEKLKLAQNGINIPDPSINGEIMLSRAFGDVPLKKYGIKCEPFIQKSMVSIKNTYEYFFLASDGIWDYITENEIQKLIPNCLDTEILSKTLIKMALSRGAWDNISLFVIRLT